MNGSDTPPEGYPAEFRGADLLGITNDRLAAYHDGRAVFLAERKDGRIRSPPDGYGLCHEVDLEAFEWTVSQYLVETAIDQGPWRPLSEFGERHLEQTGYSPSDIVRE